jgi:hypothetical protein
MCFNQWFLTNFVQEQYKSCDCHHVFRKIINSKIQEVQGNSGFAPILLSTQSTYLNLNPPFCRDMHSPALIFLVFLILICTRTRGCRKHTDCFKRVKLNAQRR